MMNFPEKHPQKRVKTPSVLQMEAVECGAASLAMILAYYECIVPLERMRQDCGVSRDGSKASNLLKAARKYGMTAKGYHMDIEGLREIATPAILFWNFNHFVVFEGFKGKSVYINDPASGPRSILLDEFNQSFTGIVLTFEKGPSFKKGGKKPSVVKSLGKRLSGYRAVISLVVLTGLFLIIPGLVIPTFSKIFVDDILVARMENWIRPLIVAMVITTLLRGILTWIQKHYLLRFETKLAISESIKFFRYIFRLPVEFFSQRYAGDIGSRFVLNDRVATLLSEELAANFLNLVMVFFYAALMFQYDVILTSLSVFIALLNLAILKYVSGKRTLLNQSLQQQYGKLMGISMNGLQMIETLKATGSESDFYAQWSGNQAKVINTRQKLAVPNQLLSVLPVTLLSLNNIAILAIGALRVMDGYLTMGMLVAFQSLMMSFLQPFNQMVNLGGVLQDTKAYLTRLDDVFNYQTDKRFDTPSPQNAKKDTTLMLSGKSKLSGVLEIKNISFGYSKLEPPLIENFSLTLTPGARVALVGGSGSGKSTIAKLISGLYEPWEGDILYDGLPFHQIPRYLMTNSLSLVDQDIFLFEGTVRDNITMWDETITDLEVTRAAKDACIHDDIASRMGGYYSLMGEGGDNFSGGQRQRIEIARALVINPSILIMDEATSALDTQTEKIIDDNLRKRGCTCVIVAHRLSTIRDADEIIVLRNGKVVERGTHEELMSKDGVYAGLIKAA